MLQSLVSSPVLLWSVLLTPIAYAIYCVLTTWIRLLRLERALDVFPSDPKHWLLGHADKWPGFNEAGLKFHRDKTARFPKVSQMSWGRIMPTIVTCHPETTGKLMKTSEPKQLGQWLYGFGLPWLGDGLLLSQGSKWSRNRRLLTPAFHFDILKPYMKINNECADMLLDKLSKAADCGKNFEFFSNISLYTFDVILRCAMSYVTDIQTRGGTSHPYITAVNRLGDIWLSRLWTSWKHYDLLFYLSSEGREFRKLCDYVHAVSGEVIRKRQADLKTGTAESRSKRHPDFLDILLTAQDADGKGLTVQEIRDEVDTFMFEGHDTTSSAISFTLFSLAEHVDIQRRCQEEIDEILQGRDSDEILWDDLSKLTYLTQVIKESLRLHSPVAFIGRCLTKDMEMDGKIIPKGTNVDIQIYNVHHNPTVWEDHMEFRPSRFDPGNMDKMDSFAFVPFSAGPRNCIGQNFAMHEMKTVIARILRRFDLAIDPNYKMEKKIGLVLKPEKDIELKVSARVP